MRDYWLSKLFFDFAGSGEDCLVLRRTRTGAGSLYVEYGSACGGGDDAAYLSQRVNPYLPFLFPGCWHPLILAIRVMLFSGAVFGEPFDVRGKGFLNSCILRSHESLHEALMVKQGLA